MTKFNRQYILTIVFPTGSPLTIQLPFTLEFDITRNTLTSANVCSIRLYNLAPLTRNQLLFNCIDSSDFYGVILQAGYGPIIPGFTPNLPVIFSGNITQAWSVREGTDFITTLECFDGGYAFTNGVTNQTFTAGTPNKTVITTLAKSLPKTTLGTIGNYPGSLSKGNAVSGRTADILRNLTGGGFFIDNGVANCLGNSEAFNGPLPIIDSSTGLLGTPVRERTIVNFDMIFEPRLQCGQQIQVNSSTGANYNGTYVVKSIKHRGTISGAVSGDATTSATFFAPSVALTVYNQ